MNIEQALLDDPPHQFELVPPQTEGRSCCRCRLRRRMPFPWSVLGFVVTVPKELTKLIKPQYDYVKKLDSNFTKLQNEYDDLCAMKEDTSEQILKKQAKRTKRCSHWFDEAGPLEDKFQELKEEYQSGEQNLQKCRGLGSKIVKTTKDIAAHVKKMEELAKTGGVMIESEPEGPKHKVVLFKSLKKNLQKLLEYVRDENVKRIGVWGMAGIGKTTLLLKVKETLLLNENEAYKKDSFDRVIWISVRGVQEKDVVKNIQEDILRQLKLNPTANGNHNGKENASKISEALKGMKYLVFLDHVYSVVNLDDVGIPLSHNRGTVVLASTDKHVCLQMGADDTINVASLPPKDIQTLFRSIVGERDPSFRDIADSKVEGLGGNPWIIRAVATYLKNESSVDRWNTILQECELPIPSKQGHLEDLRNTIKANNMELPAIPTSFFAYMSKLQLLDLCRTRIESLPKSLFKLVKLRGLYLNQCEHLTVIPAKIAKLKNLEVLDIRETSIHCLPIQIGKLGNLKCFRVSLVCNCVDEGQIPQPKIPPNLVKNLHQLEELTVILVCKKPSCKQIDNTIAEVADLKKLTTLCFHFPDEGSLETFVRSASLDSIKGLRSFKILVGSDERSLRFAADEGTSPEIGKLQTSVNLDERLLRFASGDRVPQEIKHVLKQANAFELIGNLSVQSLSEFGMENMISLKSCLIKECDLKYIQQGPTVIGSLGNLRTLVINGCHKLTKILSYEINQQLGQLQRLTVQNCSRITEIIEAENLPQVSGKSLSKLETLELVNLRNLHCSCNKMVSNSTLNPIAVSFMDHHPA
ncbi:hypothetical protein RHMOL_Rhmol03G0014400 [Rhododendron molle]|uniref:Uncharacterized protein n=1 Tax=Rhododendron molle TaxID=49168 RepID=A0ACC0P968_RHOML|nr:hypothetical protein RHMOL_Rhmol03G0014400 [Rhododendron molle]